MTSSSSSNNTIAGIPGLLESDFDDPIKAGEILDSLFQESVQLAEESKSWPVLYRHGNITTRHLKTKGPYKYLQRSSIHYADEVTYDQLRELLFIDHTINEPRYMIGLTDAILQTNINEEADIFWLGFKTPALSSNREFVELVATREIARSFMVVSQPIQTKKEVKKGYVRGAYQAWEMVTERETEKGEKFVEWICIQRSSPGGKVPMIIANHHVGSIFHTDVTMIIKVIEDDLLKAEGEHLKKSSSSTFTRQSRTSSNNTWSNK